MDRLPAGGRDGCGKYSGRHPGGDACWRCEHSMGEEQRSRKDTHIRVRRD